MKSTEYWVQKLEGVVLDLFPSYEDALDYYNIQIKHKNFVLLETQRALEENQFYKSGMMFKSIYPELYKSFEDKLISNLMDDIQNQQNKMSAISILNNKS